METKGFFSTWSHHKCLSLQFLIHLNIKSVIDGYFLGQGRWVAITLVDKGAVEWSPAKYGYLYHVGMTLVDSLYNARWPSLPQLNINDFTLHGINTWRWPNVGLIMADVAGGMLALDLHWVNVCYRLDIVFDCRCDPSKHETLNQCWFNVGPPSATLSQH